jgi:hypothetical protein
MMNKYLLTITIGLMLFSCKPVTSDTTQADTNSTSIEETNASKFWNQLKSLQGKTFEGQLQNAPANDDFAGKRLIMHVLYSDNEKILIPFNVGENRSRTWIFTRKDGRIELKHDHRHEDGTSDEVTMYGGTSTNDGKPDMQVFPADEQTAQMLPHAYSNVWWVTVDSTTYTYNLRRMGTERFFSVSFDLTKELEKPEPSWGWEEFGK